MGLWDGVKNKGFDCSARATVGLEAARRSPGIRVQNEAVSLRGWVGTANLMGCDSHGGPCLNSLNNNHLAYRKEWRAVCSHDTDV